MPEYTLIRRESANKAGRFLYIVTDQDGRLISERRSNREYVACAANGKYYFGRPDLVGKGQYAKDLQSSWFAGLTPEEKETFTIVHLTPESNA